MRHVPPDRHGGSVELFARPRRVDRRKGSRLDAVSTQLPSPPIEVAEVDTRRQLDRRPVAFELDEAARPEERFGTGEIAFPDIDLQPLDLVVGSKALELVGEPPAQTLASIEDGDADQPLGSLLESRAVLAQHGLRDSGKRSVGRPGADPYHRLLGRPEAVVEDRPCRVVLPVAALVSKVDPRFELLTTHGANQERGTALRHDRLRGYRSQRFFEDVEPAVKFRLAHGQWEQQAD